MFFSLSKIMRFLISPLFWIAAVFVVSLFVKKWYIKKRLLVISGLMFLFFTNTFIADEFMRWWEKPAVKHTEMDVPYDVGILLTGMCTWDAEFERINFENSSDRLLQTMELYQQGLIKKIFISGGSGDIRQPEFQEAALLHDYLVRAGIPDEDVAWEAESRNTAENSIKTAQYMNPESTDSTFLLITSAYHMRRAQACFEKQGFELDTYSTDRFTGKRKFHIDYLLLPRVDAMLRWEVLIKEYTGMIMYKLKGYV